MQFWCFSSAICFYLVFRKRNTTRSTSLSATTVNNLYYNLFIKFTRSFIHPYLFLNEPHLRLASMNGLERLGKWLCNVNTMNFKRSRKILFSWHVPFNETQKQHNNLITIAKRQTTPFIQALTHTHTYTLTTKSSSQYRPRRFCDRTHKNVRRQTNNQTQTVQMCASQSHQRTNKQVYLDSSHRSYFFRKQLCRRASAAFRCFQACNYRGLACCIFNCFITRRDVLEKKQNTNIEVSGDNN